MIRPRRGAKSPPSPSSGYSATSGPVSFQNLAVSHPGEQPQAPAFLSLLSYNKYSWGNSYPLGTLVSATLEREGASVCVDGLHSCQQSQGCFQSCLQGPARKTAMQWYCRPEPLVTVVVPAPFLLLTQLPAFPVVQSLAFKLHVSFLFPPLCSPRPVTFMRATSFLSAHVPLQWRLLSEMQASLCSWYFHLRYSQPFDPVLAAMFAVSYQERGAGAVGCRSVCWALDSIIRPLLQPKGSYNPGTCKFVPFLRSCHSWHFPA